MSKLKPCPFCGETATLDYSVLLNGKHWFITCDCCGMMYQDVISQRKYVKDGWNTRPIEDALRKRIAELEEAMRWIPVSERLPEVGKVVDVIDMNFIDYFTKTELVYETAALVEIDGIKLFGFVNEDSVWSSKDVTHWMYKMPLPEPPNDTQTDSVVYGKDSD